MASLRSLRSSHAGRTGMPMNEIFDFRFSIFDLEEGVPASALRTPHSALWFRASALRVPSLLPCQCAALSMGRPTPSLHGLLLNPSRRAWPRKFFWQLRQAASSSSRSTGVPHQQSGRCIYITNMQNMNLPLFCILDLGPAYFLTYICKIICKIIVAGSYSAYSTYYNMQNMQNM